MLRSANPHLSVSDLAFEIDGDGALKIEEREGGVQFGFVGSL